MTDKNVVRQVLGGLMQRPQLLSEVDKYSLTITDFSSKFEKYIFSAIMNLYCKGAEVIQPIDIYNYLESDTVGKTIFENNHGVEYLQDVIEFSSWENFPYYYDKLKKLNLIRDLKKQGFDTSDFYCEDLTRRDAEEINSRFETLTATEICNGVKAKLLRLESTYAKTSEIEEERACDNIADFISAMSTTIDIGSPLQGSMYNKIFSGAQRQALTIRSGCSGMGKALPNSTLIPTPIGWRRVDEIAVGDYLFDAFGKPTKVLNVYPQGKKTVWQVTFKDGRTARCCDEHLWSYNTCSQKKNAKKNRRFYTKTLSEIMQEPLRRENGDYRILVPMQGAVEYPEQSHHLPPYVLGLLLGDGSFRQNTSNKSLQFSSADAELPEAIGAAMCWKVKKGSGNNYTWYFATKDEQVHQKEKVNVWVEDALIEHPELINTGSKEKFIPRSYIEDSIENRYALLRGLLDTDGSIDIKGRVTYFTISENLRDSVVEIARSLGFKTHVMVDTHKETNVGYIVSIQGIPENKLKLFSLTRKKQIAEQYYSKTTRFEANTHNPIVEIKNLGYEEEMTCFYVDNEEHLFLTENFVVTHNTRQSVADACYLAYPIRYNSRTRQWEMTGSCEKVLYIMTEQTMAQIKRMIVAYLSDINESRFKLGNFTSEEEKILEQTIQIMEKYKDNLILVKMPNPNIELIKTIVRENCMVHNIDHVFYDYIFIGPALLDQFRGFSLRNDKLLSYI